MKGRDRRRFQDALAGTLEPQALEQALDANAVFPDGVRTRVTLLYAELQGAAGPSGDAPAPLVVAALREWLNALSHLAQKDLARVQRVLGQGFLATFGDPLSQPNHAEKAVACALAAQADTARLQQTWAQHGLAGTQFRAAVATGEVIMADVGGPEAAVYGPVGPIVSLAELLLTKAPPGGVLVSEETKNTCAESFDFQGVPRFPLKGRGDLYQSYLVLGTRLSSDPERIATRLPSFADVIVRTAAQAAPGWVDNVSAGGLHVSTVLALRVGDPVSVEFAPVPELTGAAPVVVHGHVRHLRPVHDGSPGFGILIDRADSANSDALRHFVALYFAPLPAATENEVLDSDDFYRLELGDNYVKLIRDAGKPPS